MHSKKYHHGDLHSTLLKAATEIIHQGGVDALSMRKLADKVGVSRTAPYHHFKDKNELLCAIAEAGFAEQSRLLTRFRDEVPLGKPFADYVRGYLHFASDNPETYDLMYGKEIWKLGEATQSLKETSRASFKLMVSWTEALQQQHILTQQQPTLRVTQTVWATLHGLSRLLNDGIYVHREDMDDMVNTAAAMLTSNSATAAQ